MADSKVQNLNGGTAVAPGAPTDVLYYVKDPAGTPLDRPVTMQQIGDYIKKIGAVSRARVYNSSHITGLNLDGAGQTVITYDSERYDTDSYHSTSSNTGRLTVPVTGFYLVTLNIQVEFTSTSGITRPWTVYTGVRLNGSTEVALDTKPTGAVQGSGGTLYPVASLLLTSLAVIYPATAGDYFDSTYYISTQSEPSFSGAVRITASGNR